MTDTHNKTICLHNVTLIDGTGSKPKSGVDIHVKDGRIERITETLDPAYAQPRFVMPGLIDCHVHLCIDGAAHAEVRGGNDFVALKMLKHAQTCLQSGITSMRDVGGWYGIEFALRAAFEDGLWIGPRLALAGKLLSISSSGADLYPGMYREADGVDEVRKAAREQFKAGADLIKLMASGAVMAKDEKPEATQFGVDEMSAAVEEARKIGKPVAAHAHAAQAIRNAVEAGVNSVEHGTYLHRDAQLMEEMASKGTFLVPTLKVFHDMHSGIGVPAWMQEKAKYVHQDHTKSISKAISAGVTIAMGTDSATPYNFHGRNAVELQLLSDCGMSSMQTIVASTSTAAKLLGWHHWLGTVEPGKVADLLVLSKNPLDDLRSLSDRQNILMVIKDGQVVAKSAEVKDEAENLEPFVCCGLPDQ